MAAAKDRTKEAATPRRRQRTDREQQLAELGAAAAEAAGEVDGLTEQDIAELEREYQPVEKDGTINPVQIGKAGRRPNDLVHIFTLDGQDYFVPRRPSAASMVKFLKDARNPRIGRRVAVENLLTDVLGDENLAALASSTEVDDEDCANVFAIVAHLCFGRLQEMIARAGESSRGSKK